MKEEYSEYKRISRVLDREFSPTFCLAKWYHSNIYLQTGETHSCYHPPAHAISVDEIQRNPSALHNTGKKIAERSQMLAGIRPTGCQYCWNIEDLGPELLSDRHIRTGSLFRKERVAEIKNSPFDFAVSPEYIEISFSNLCNFKCGYCHPKASSRFRAEIQQFGPYAKSKNHRCDIDWFEIFEEDNNPYLEAWWKWWPEVSKTLNILRITGGEPLLQKSTYHLMDSLESGSHSKLELNVNSNLGSSSAVVRRFYEQAQRLVTQGKIKSFVLFTSVDTWGPQAEYVRFGLDLSLFEANLLSYLANTDLPLTFMITFNVFSLPSLHLLLEKILEWRTAFPAKVSDPADYQHFHRIRFDISYLKEPLQFDINILPKEEFLGYLENCLNFVKANVDNASQAKFSFIEYQRVLRIYEYMRQTHYDAAKIQEGRRDFFTFFKEYDRRKGTSLLKTFPEFAGFWDECAKLATP